MTSTSPTPSSSSPQQQQQQQPEPLNFRPPSTISPPKLTTFTLQPTQFIPPPTSFIVGTWHVHHSTLPMWKTKRNVQITYNLVPNQPSTFDNVVTYQALDSDKLETVKGIEKPDGSYPAAWNWRGKGWLRIASSHWEALGWGEEEPTSTHVGKGESKGNGNENGWMVIWFEKTLFTPAGVDLLTRRKEGVSRELLERVKRTIEEVEDDGFRKFAGELFVVKHDD